VNVHYIGSGRKASGFRTKTDRIVINLWLADRNPVYTVTSPAPNVLRIAHEMTAVALTLDPAVLLPVKTLEAIAQPPQDNHEAGDMKEGAVDRE